MADPRLTQSPQQMRGSAQNYDKYAKGEVRATAEEISKNDASNSGDNDPWSHLGKTTSEFKPSA